MRPRNNCSHRLVCMCDMALIGRLHPMLVHFPIGLVLISAVAEAVARTTDLQVWGALARWDVPAGPPVGVRAAVPRSALAPSARSVPRPHRRSPPALGATPASAPP